MIELPYNYIFIAFGILFSVAFMITFVLVSITVLSALVARTIEKFALRGQKEDTDEG